MSKRWHLTPKEKARIKKLTLQRVPQAEISRRLHIGHPTVGKVQREMGLPTRPPTPEKEIVKLFHEGWGGLRIHKHLRVPANQVFATFKKFGLRRNPTTPKENEDRFIAALKRGEGYIRTLRARYGVAFCRANRIARETLGTYRFRPGASKPPLSSDFPQKHFPKKMGKK